MSDAPLSASGEASWQSLRQHIEWTPGFWIGWLFTDHTPSVHELHQRISAQLRGVNRSTQLRQPRQPEELIEILSWLLAGAEECDGCAVVAVVQSAQAWRDAWDHFLLRLNERRELLRQHLRGGLLLCAPTSFKPRTREAAPDLWSIRSLALDIAPVTNQGHDSWRSPPDAEQTKAPVPAAPVALTLQAVEAAVRAGQVDAEVEARLRAAEALFAAGRRDESREQAVHAVQVAPNPSFRARALVKLAEIERHLEDVVAAERHYLAANETDAQVLRSRDYRELSRLLTDRGALAEALAAAEAALSRSREQRSRTVDTSSAMRDESMSLRAVGDVMRQQMRRADAEAAYTASLDLARKIRALAGDTPEALEEESVARGRTGIVKEERGDLSGAREDYETSFHLAHQVREIEGDTEQALRNESIALRHVADVMSSQGERHVARTLYDESLRLTRQIREQDDGQIEHIDDEALALHRIGNIQHALGDHDGARRAYEASLELCRQARRVAGGTPQTLRREAFSASYLAELLASGPENEALQACEGSLEASRNFARTVGGTPEALLLMAAALHRLGQVHRRHHRREVARDQLVEAVRLWRDLYGRGHSPELARRLAQALDDLADVLREEAAALRTAENE